MYGSLENVRKNDRSVIANNFQGIPKALVPGHLLIE